MRASWGAATGQAPRRLILAALLLAGFVRAKGDCSAVEVKGGDLAGLFNATENGYEVVGSDVVLQPIAFGPGDDRRRRGLAGSSRETGAGGRPVADEQRKRVLADDEPCTDHMWILTNTSQLVDGFPYYAAFDCAEDPGDINSTWVFVACKDCPVETTEMRLECLSSTSASTETESASNDDGSGSSLLSTPVIIAIAVAAAAAIAVCFVVGCCIRKRSLQGSNSFENESEATQSKMMAGGGGGGSTTGGDGSTLVGVGPRSPPLGETSSAGAGDGNVDVHGLPPPVYKSVNSQDFLSRSSVKEAHEAPMAVQKKRNNLSFDAARDGLPYDPRLAIPRAASGHSASAMSSGMKDSMAAAAAAAAVASGRFGSGNQHTGTVAFVPEPERQVRRSVRQAVREEDIAWSAGQGHPTRGGRYANGVVQHDYGEDSAAGSEFSLNPDTVTDHQYNDIESMPASSPGAYSMYSHFTAGGHSIYHGDGEDERYGSEGSWAGEEGHHHEVQAAAHTRVEQDRIPESPAYEGVPAESAASVAAEAAMAVPLPKPSRRGSEQMQAPRSPAGLVARADRVTKQGSRRPPEPLDHVYPPEGAAGGEVRHAHRQ